MEKEYIVILKNAKDLDQFYEDMESRYGDNEIPARIVECVQRKPNSRSTHYRLTDEEAEQVKQDSRVLNVTRTPQDLGLIRELHSTTINPQAIWNYFYPPEKSQNRIYSGWNKMSGYNDPWVQFPGNSDPDLQGARSAYYGSTAWINWALLRCTKREQITNWGSDGSPEVFESVTLGVQGEHVDVVIIDGSVDPKHIEFNKNSTGTGNSRFKYHNWWQHEPAVSGGPAGTYPNYATDYESYPLTSDSNHGTLSASIVAGNSCGWARKANIYNIDFLSNFNVINYVREFHRTKPINPLTGRKNPTIVNMSYGYAAIRNMDESKYVWYKGTKYTRPSSGSWIWVNGKLDLTARFKFGLIGGYYNVNIFGTGVSENIVYYQTRVPSIDEDIADGIAEGIIFVAAAGNAFHYVDNPSATASAHYNNRLSLGDFENFAFDNQYFHRGPTPGAAPGVIMVSASDCVKTDRKADFSCAGPRTDIFAPGVGITGAGNGAYFYDDKISQVDPRSVQLDVNGNFEPKPPYTKIHYRTRLAGTSFASPNVCGVLAAILEAYPTLNAAQAKTKLIEMSTSNQLLNEGPTFNPSYSNTHFSRLNTTTYGAPNRYLGYISPPVSQSVLAEQKFPICNYGTRNADGQTWPRAKFYRQP